MSERSERTGSDLATDLDRRWSWLLRRGPYVLLAATVVLCLATGPAFGTADRAPTIVALSVLLAVGHWWCGDRPRDESTDDALGHVYVFARTLVAFVLTWLNPLGSLYAAAGYFDAERYARGRWAMVVRVGSAITLAAAQSGGLPIHGVQYLLFAMLLIVHVMLMTVFARLGRDETALADERAATIAALEEANAKLERALDDNAILEAELWERARAEGVRDERERLALELHDTVAQGLAGIVTQLQAAADVPVAPVVAEHLQRAETLARSSLQDARRVVVALGPDGLGGSSLPSVLTERVRSWSEEHVIDADVVVTGDPLALGPDREVVVLRIVMEALANTARHAGASRATVTLSYTDDEVMVDVRDDGSGFDPRATVADEISGFGIGGMRRRAERAGGDLLVESEEGGGTAVSLRLPSAHDD
ncbi:sensor histidine kinase [Aeromicrobium piscarium]|uniref:Oxygen sensor histidine kinase NreB n=1 Tax=Aeromicrobium piscarium TaxID=2590901 RepID=A0A554RWC0_9ACTN|nr:sensor histidine kinase [Aeromicrobium piscarium]TSD58398.1 sensor histidine kinase [Aeromicrobium piscarium]